MKFIFFFVLFGSEVFADAAMNSMAKMRAIQLQPVALKETRLQLEAIKKTRALSEHEKKTESLTALAEALKVDTIYTANPKSNIPDQGAITTAINKSIDLHPGWDFQLGKDELSKIADLEKAFGNQSYLWAWVLNQNGDKAKAKAILSNLASDGYANVMKMKMIHFGNNPFVEQERIHKALMPMSTESEKKILNSQLQEMKTHVSNLPDSMIMT